MPHECCPCVARLRAQVQRAKDVHQPIDAIHETRGEMQVCAGCGTDNGNWQRWPCPTIRALGGGA